MKRNSPKKPKESARDRHLKWINYYGSKNFGIWVECTECKKWRRNFQYTESHEVPEKWCCSMLTLESGEKGSCMEPEEEITNQCLDYSPGSIVWAKLTGYPWWPGMVDGDPDTDEYFWREGDNLFYNVTFLDKKPTRAWIPEKFICPFSEPSKVKKGCLVKYKQNKYAKAILRAKTIAEAAMKMAIKDRLQTYSFVHLYKGRWPSTPDFEDNDIEENENNNVDMADVLLKKPDEPRPSDSINTGGNRITDFNRKRNDTAKKGKMISKNPDILSLKKKTCNKKLLSNEDFVLENKGVFPFTKKKYYKYPSSVRKTLRNDLVNCAKNLTDPVQEKKAKVMKRKINRKFTPRKVNKFDKPFQNLTGDIIDLESTNSEYESNKIFHIVSVPKEDVSVYFDARRKMYVAESNANGLSEVFYYEKHSYEKLSNNVRYLNEKKLNKKGNIFTGKITHSSHLSSNEEIGKNSDEAISIVSAFVKNGNLKIFNESNSFVEKKVFEGSNKLQKNSQKSFENIKHSNNKIKNLTGKTHLFRVPPETNFLPNVRSSTLKINKQIITEVCKLTKESQKTMRPKDGWMSGFSKQPTFSVPVKKRARRNDEAVDRYNSK